MIFILAIPQEFPFLWLSDLKIRFRWSARHVATRGVEGNRTPLLPSLTEFSLRKTENMLFWMLCFKIRGWCFQGLMKRCNGNKWVNDALINPFSTNVPLCSWFLLAKCLKHFTGKNQLPGLSISGTLVENGFNIDSIFAV